MGHRETLQPKFEQFVTSLFEEGYTLDQIYDVWAIQNQDLADRWIDSHALKPMPE